MPRKRVLLVEDSATVRGRLREVLQSDPEIELVGEAADGKRAIRKFSIRKYGETNAFQRAKTTRKGALTEMGEPHANSRGLKNWLRRRAEARSDAISTQVPS